MGASDRALQLAGIAASEPARLQAAEDRALAAVTYTDRLRRITDASLCHGWAGLLTVTRTIAADSPATHRFTEPIEQLTRYLATDIAGLPKPGFMEGRAGSQLALEGTNNTGWTRALLID
jgi:hypothetical protein